MKVIYARQKYLCCLLFGFVALGAAVPMLIFTAAVAVEEPTSESKMFPLNSNGQSYGSELDAATFEERPDLIAAIATNGRSGFVGQKELDMASMRELTSPVEIPVYDLGGEVIGAFEISVPSDEGADMKQGS